MTIRTSLILAAALLSLAACNRPNDSAFYNRGGPESLLDVSSEVVNLGVSSPQELTDLSDWVAKDKPTRAELYCIQGDLACAKAEQVLALHGVPVMMVAAPQSNVTLIYERILARDCSPRFLDNHDNSYNTNHPAYGCAVAANIVQHVSDKQQLISPSLSDPQPARVAIQAYDRAYVPYTSRPQYSVDQSLAAASTSQ